MRPKEEKEAAKQLLGKGKKDDRSDAIDQDDLDAMEEDGILNIDTNPTQPDGQAAAENKDAAKEPETTEQMAQPEADAANTGAPEKGSQSNNASKKGGGTSAELATSKSMEFPTVKRNYKMLQHIGMFKNDTSKAFDFDPFIDKKRFTKPTFASKYNSIANPPPQPEESAVKYPSVDLKRYLRIRKELNVEKRAKERE